MNRKASLDGIVAGLQMNGVAAGIKNNSIIIHIFIPEDMGILFKFKKHFSNYQTASKKLNIFAGIIEKMLRSKAKSIPIIPRFQIWDGIPVYGAWEAVEIPIPSGFSIHSQYSDGETTNSMGNEIEEIDFDEICKKNGIFPATF